MRFRQWSTWIIILICIRMDFLIHYSVACDLWPMTGIQLNSFIKSNWILKNWLFYLDFSVTCDFVHMSFIHWLLSDLRSWLVFECCIIIFICIRMCFFNSLLCSLWLGSNWVIYPIQLEIEMQCCEITFLCNMWSATRIQFDNYLM